jgi:protein-S-isoprenylcysteine O-methyltransferase Ste14
MESAAGTFIIVCWASFYVYLLVTATKTKPTVKRNRQLWRFWLTALLFAAAVVAVQLFPDRQNRLSGPLVGQSAPQDIGADVVTFLGVVGAFWARVALGGNWSSSAEIKEGQELVQRGPYRYVRYPLYSGILLMALGLVVWFGLIGLLPFLVVFLILLIRSRQEESLLTSYFPEAYPEYRRRTKALIPFVF